MGIKYEQTVDGELFTFVNSWEGDPGGSRFRLPAEYLQNSLLCRDVWALTSLDGGGGNYDGGETSDSITTTTTVTKSTRRPGPATGGTGSRADVEGQEPDRRGDDGGSRPGAHESRHGVVHGNVEAGPTRRNVP